MNNLRLNTTILLLTTLFTQAQCQSPDSPPTTSAPDTVPGIILSNMDTTVRPGQDFYRYVNGGWMAANKIPDDRVRWNAHDGVRKEISDDILTIIRNTSPDDYAANSSERKVLLLFASAMDTTARNAAGVAPLRAALRKIANAQNLQELVTTDVVTSQPFFELEVFSDFDDSSINAVYLDPESLGLSQDYYLDQDSVSQKIRSEYLKHIARMFRFAGDTAAQAQQRAEAVLSLETQLAKARLDKVQQRDRRELNNPYHIAELSTLTPAIDWKQWMLDTGVGRVTT